MTSEETDPELRLCRLYGCRHEDRDHGVTDGYPRCWRCVGDRVWHQFTRRDRTAAERERDARVAAEMRRRMRRGRR